MEDKPKIERAATLDVSTSSGIAEPVFPTFEVIYSKVFAVVCGFVALSAWNTFLTALGFFQARLNKGNANLAVILPSSNSVAGNVGLLSSIFLNTLFIYRFNRSVRVYVTLGINILGFIFLFVLNAYEYDSPRKAKVYFYLLLTIAFFLNVSSSIMQAVYCAIIAHFEVIYINYYLYGQAIAGLIISLFSLASIAFGVGKATSEYIYFSFPLVTSVLCGVAFIIFQRLSLYKHKVGSASLAQSSELTHKQSLKNYKVIFLQIWKYACITYFNFLITLLFFPVMMMSVSSSSQNTTWSNKYFWLFHTFVVFNLGDVLGRIPPQYLKWPHKFDNFLILLTLLRILFIPAYLFCNIKGSPFPSIFKHDICPIILMFLFAFTNGMYGTIAFGKGSNRVDSKLREQCNNLIVFFLAAGLCSGSFMSFSVTKWISSL